MSAGCKRAARAGLGLDGESRKESRKKERRQRQADSHLLRAQAAMEQGNYDVALKEYDEAIKQTPKDVDLWIDRGHAWHLKALQGPDRAGCEARAFSDFAEALRLDPSEPWALNNRAWIRATSKVDQHRNAKAAIEEATRACELTEWLEGQFIDTLACAYAENGDFQKAHWYENKALEVDADFRRTEGATAKLKLDLFLKNQPFRE